MARIIKDIISHKTRVLGTVDRIFGNEKAAFILYENGIIMERHVVDR